MTGITPSQATASIKTGETKDVTVTPIPETDSDYDGTKLKATSSDTSIANVAWNSEASAFRIVAVKAGKADIDFEYNDLTAKVAVTVTDPAQG